MTFAQASNTPPAARRGRSATGYSPLRRTVYAFDPLGQVSGPGELHPEALTDPCLSLSAHTARAIHGELAPSVTTRRFLPLPVDQLGMTRMTRPLRSVGITPLHS
jgi:hypothetical protein